MDDQVPVAQPVPATPPQVGQATPDPAAATPAPISGTPTADQIPELTTEQIVEGDIFDLLNLGSMPEEEKDMLRETMLTSIQDRVMLRVSDLLPPEEFEKLKVLLEADGNDDAIRILLDTNGVDIQQLTMEESILYKDLLANAVDQLKRG